MKKKNRTKETTIYTIVFIVYLCVLLYFLFFSDVFGRNVAYSDYRYNLKPFAEIKRFTTQVKNSSFFVFLINIAGNVIVFLPFGFLFPRTVGGISGRTPKFAGTFLAAILFSLLVEVMQLVSRVGVFDVDDIILNVSGAAVGYLLHRIFRKRG